MICPNCGASNGANAVYCNRCRQRLPLAGPNSGISYPYRRSVASRVGGNNRGRLYGALFLVFAALFGVILAFAFSPPRGTPPGTDIAAGASPTAQSTLPTFTPEAPSATPTPLPTIIIDLTTPTPTAELTPSPTPTPESTPKPTKKPTPTPTQAPLSCADAQGTRSVVIGFGNRTERTSRGWCVTSVVFHIVTGSSTTPGSTFGTAMLVSNGKTLKQYTCAPPVPCQNDVEKVFGKPRFVASGDVLAYKFTCGVAQDPDSIAACNADPQAFKATITINYEAAISP